MEQQELPLSPFAEEIEEADLGTETENSPFQDKKVEEPEEENEAEDIEDEELDPEIQEILDELTEEELEEIGEEADENEAEEEEDSEDDTSNMVPHQALHKERERRKELQQKLAELEAMSATTNERINAYKTAIDNIRKQAKELGIDDMLDIEAPAEPDEETLKLKAEKQAQEQQKQLEQAVNDMRSYAADLLPEYPQIDGNSPEQAEIILGYAMTAAMMGIDMEEAVEKAMSTLNKQLADAVKKATRPVKRRPVAKATTKRRKPSAQTKLKKGDIHGYFRDVAGNMTGE